MRETEYFNGGENMENKTEKIIIPEKEYTIDFVRSSGHGGQNVNKLATKTQLRFNIGLSNTLSEEQKMRIRQQLAHRITKNDELILGSQAERSQWQNRKNVIEKLHQLINEALEPEKERIPTKPTRSSREKRIHEKKHRGEIKKMRQKPLGED